MVASFCSRPRRNSDTNWSVTCLSLLPSTMNRSSSFWIWSSRSLGTSAMEPSTHVIWAPLCAGRKRLVPCRGGKGRLPIRGGWRKRKGRPYPSAKASCEHPRPCWMSVYGLDGRDEGPCEVCSSVDDVVSDQSQPRALPRRSALLCPRGGG